jgi:hypothetical protein
MATDLSFRNKFSSFGKLWRRGRHSIDAAPRRRHAAPLENQKPTRDGRVTPRVALRYFT